MDRLPSVAVIIVNRNGDRHLIRCLEALKSQTVQPQNVVVVDNGSENRDFEQVLEQFRGGYVIRLHSNLGFACASNIGVQSAEGVQWVSLLNNDAFPEPTWLENLLKGTRVDPACAAVAPRIISDRDPQVVDGAGDLYHVSGFAWRRFSGQSQSLFAHTPREIFSAPATAVLYRRDVFQELNGFDEDFFCYFEDVDLGFRLRLAGYRAYYVPSAVVRHVGSATEGVKSSFALYHGHRNLVWTYFKNMPIPLLTVYLPQHLLFNLMSICWYAARGEGTTLLKAKMDALRRLPLIWKKRRAIQKRRQSRLLDIRKGMTRGILLPYQRTRRFQTQ